MRELKKYELWRSGKRVAVLQSETKDRELLGGFEFQVEFEAEGLECAMKLALILDKVAA